MFDEIIPLVLLKLKEWGLLVTSVVASSTALSMGLGWVTIFRRVIFSGTTSVVIASTCYYALEWKFVLSCAAGYFMSFLVESAFRQRLDAVGRALADKAVNVIQTIPGKGTGSKGNNGDQDA